MVESEDKAIGSTDEGARWMSEEAVGRKVCHQDGRAGLSEGQA